MAATHMRTANPSRPPTAWRIIVGALLNATVALIGLAYAWGRPREFIADPISVTCVLLLVAPTLALMWTSGAGTGIRALDEGRGYVLIRNLIAFAMMVLIVWFDGHGWYRLPGGVPLRVAGLLVLVAGLVLRVGAMIQLGRRFSLRIALQPNHALETRGFYRHIRHPSYLGILLMLLGYALVFESILGLALVIVNGVNPPRIRREERFLAEQFGDEWRAYAARTKRLIPGVW